MARDRPAQQPFMPVFVPVYAVNFPDPFILLHGEPFLAYATNANEEQTNVQMAVSPDMVRWQPLRTPDGKLRDAMPVLPTWAKEGWTWAPEMVRNGERYLLYFTAREAKSVLQCTGVAESRDRLSSFKSSAPEPLICQRALGGTIPCGAEALLGRRARDVRPIEGHRCVGHDVVIDQQIQPVRGGRGFDVNVVAPVLDSRRIVRSTVIGQAGREAGLLVDADNIVIPARYPVDLIHDRGANDFASRYVTLA